MSRSILILVVLVFLFGFVALRGATSIRAERRAMAICEAAAEYRWSDVLSEASGEMLFSSKETAHTAAECYCLALLMTGDRASCVDILQQGFTHDPEWTPDSVLTALIVDEWIEKDDYTNAANLLSRSLEIDGRDGEIIAREFEVRAQLEGVESACNEARARVAEESPIDTRMKVAVVALKRNAPECAIGLLGTPPRAVTTDTLEWFVMSADAWGTIGRADKMKETFDLWLQAGGGFGEITAHHAIIRHNHQLWSGTPAVAELYDAALLHRYELPERLHRAILQRRISMYAVVKDTHPEARALLAEARNTFPDFPMDERDIEMSNQLGLQEGSTTAAKEKGTLRFELPEGFAGVIRISPDTGTSIDALYDEVVAAQGGTISITRDVGIWPSRWVVLDNDGLARASGATWPVANNVVKVTPNLSQAVPSQRKSPTLPSRETADGHQRIFTVILDSVDWRLVTYLMARNELPAIRSLYRSGLHAVLDSAPAFTAAAMKAITRPSEPEYLTIPVALHGVGEQLTTFFQLGENPFSSLRLLGPEVPDIFVELSDGGRVVANMLHGHGGLNAGVHGLVWGPNNHRSRLDLTSDRALTTDERAAFPALAAPPRRYLLDETEALAAQFDDVISIAKEKSVDLLLFRAPATDHAAHSTFASLTRGAQDNGEHFLLDLYRYADQRIAELMLALDGDDVLIVMSDHGISSHMAHDRRALFVAGGGRIPKGHGNALFPIWGLPRLFADLLGVRTEWQSSGLDGWVDYLPDVVAPARTNRSDKEIR